MLHRLKYILGIAAVMGALAVSSCKKAYFYKGINDDPQQLHSPTPNLLLPGIQLKSAYLTGGDQSRFAALFTQQITGSGNQPKSYYQYIISTDDVDNLWTFGWYGAVMNDAHVMIQVSDSLGAHHYAGIARIMMANALASVTDFYGDAPYSDAFKGQAELQPKFDPQKQIYDTLHALLDRAIEDLNAEDNSIYVPGDDDQVYSGKLENWVKLAHSLKARYYLHVSKIDNTALDKVLSEGALGMDGVTDDQGIQSDFKVTFLGAAVTSSAPWAQMVDQRYQDYSFKGKVETMTAAAGDPRHDVYFDLTDPFSLGPLYGSANSPVYFMSYDELQFDMAEASFKKGNTLNAANQYNAAVVYNLKRSGVSTSYAAQVAKTAANITLNDIMTQKYIAEFLNGEVWTDWRRTGLPALTAPTPNATGGVIPRSLIYPSGEIRYNSNTQQHSLQYRVWWDAQ